MARCRASAMLSLSHTLLAHSAGASDRPLWARPLVMARVAGWCAGCSDISHRLRHRSTLRPMTIDPGALYRTLSRTHHGPGHRTADVDPDLVVPATPQWTVHDVVAHLSGISEDATSGNMAGAPGDAWTAAQVERGAGRSIARTRRPVAANSPMLEALLLVARR